MSLFEIIAEPMDGLKIIRTPSFPDNRGSFNVSFLQDEFDALGLPKFVRQMRTYSKCGVIRGLHYQLNPPMSKLVEVISGEVMLVSVDMRPESLTFMSYHSMTVKPDDNISIWASAGFARGYFVYKPAIVQYSTDAYQGKELITRWNDPIVGIKWPTQSPILSDKDKNA